MGVVAVIAIKRGLHNFQAILACEAKLKQNQAEYKY
jgi:hypothetical protein